jgi:uncharacterized membrane protein
VFKKILFTVVVILFISATFLFPFGHYFMNHDFFHNEFIKTGTYERLGVEKTTMITENLFNFFKGKEDLGFFSEEEIKHWKDVRNIWNMGNVVYTVLLILLTVTFFTLLFIEVNVAAIMARITKILLLSGIIGCMISTTFFFLASFAFAQSFDVFHLIFFKDNWWFGEDYLSYNYATQDFFKHAAIAISLLSIIVFFVYAVTGISLYIFTKVRRSRLSVHPKG